ncbi:MAG: hypothetical protein QXT73_08510 [Candidatus Methanomethylicaceae archaeon]
MVRILITLITGSRFFLWSLEHRRDAKPLDGERERLDNFILLFNNHPLLMNIDSNNDILDLKFPPDEISSSI